MKIKKIAVIMAGMLLVLFVMGCEHSLTDGDDNGESITVAALRSVALDTAQNCQIETAHEHEGITYSGHYNNDGHEYHNGELEADNICTVATCSITGTHHHSENGHHDGSGNHHA